MATAETLLTAEEYLKLPDTGQPTELVRGRVIALNPPFSRHGYYCLTIGFILKSFSDSKDLGWVLSNDSGVITERDPDTVRGGDVLFYSYMRVPRGRLPDGYIQVPPDLVFEVRSGGDRWSEILAKVSEYLNAGVLVVCVHDEITETITVYRPDQPPQVLTIDQEMALPELHADFRISVAKFF